MKPIQCGKTIAHTAILIFHGNFILNRFFDSETINFTKWKNTKQNKTWRGSRYLGETTHVHYIVVTSDLSGGKDIIGHFLGQGDGLK